MEAIRQLVLRILAKSGKSGIVTTIPKKNILDFQTMILAEKFMQNGIDPRVFKNADQAENMLKQIENADKAKASGITETQSAKIFNIEGQKLDPKKPIIGGTQTGKELSPELSKRLAETNTQRIKQKIADKAIDDDLPPPGSRGGPEDIAAPVQTPEEYLKNVMEGEIKANLEAQNKKSIENILKRKNREDVYGLDDYDTTNMSDIKKQIIRLETTLGNLNPDEAGFKEMADDLINKIGSLQKKLRDDKADGGRIGFVKGTGFKFLQKIFGKEKFKEMATRDPEMYQGLLEVVDMYRKRDKEGLKMYLQKFLPHMDDTEIENFIIGSDGTEGLIGELIRLGSGRDYKGKIDMIKRAQNMRKLDDLEVTENMIRKPNASGGIAKMLGE